MNKNNNIYNRQNSTNINWYPGHMAKTKRLIKEKFDLIDIIYELVDARIPYSSKIKDIDAIVKNKTRILIMTKSDLCDKHETKKWISFYEEKGYHVLLVDLNNNTDYKKIITLTNKLMEEKQINRTKKGLKEKDIKVLVIGIPNVGKSTLINRLANKKVVNVGNKPGITKALSWIKTTYNITLLDTPGILWPKFDNNQIAYNLGAMTAIKEELLPIDKISYYVLNMLKNYYPDILKNRYKLDSIPNDTLEIYERISANMGIKKIGDDVDYDKVSLIIVNDIKSSLVTGITFDRKEN